MEVFQTGKSGTGLSLVDLVTPCAIVTGVFTCGIICWINIWMDRRYLPRPIQMSLALIGLNLVAGTAFFVVGLRSLYDIPWLGIYSWIVLGAIFGLGAIVSILVPPLRASTQATEIDHELSDVSPGGP